MILLLSLLVAEPGLSECRPVAKPPPVKLARGRWNEANARRIEALIEAKGARSPSFDPCDRPLATFDFDDTTVDGDVGDLVLAEALERKFLRRDVVLELSDEAAKKAIGAAWPEKDDGPASPELRIAFHRAYDALCAKEGPPVCYPWITQAFAGHDEKELLVFADEVIDRSLEGELSVETLAEDVHVRRGVRPRPEILDVMGRLAENGFDVAIVTASPEWLVRRFAEKLQLPVTVIGMRTGLDPARRSTTEVVPPVTYARGKVTAIATRLAPGGRRPVIAFGDARSDFEMLSAAELAVLIDKGKIELVREGRARGFSIQSFPR